MGRRTGDITWAFDDLEGEGRLALASSDLTLELDALYHDALGIIIA